MPLYSQTELPYYEVPEFPEKYNAGTVAARMIDGLGFRFYWSTEGVREQDLDFKPSKEARTFLQTVEHIYSMSKTIVNATQGNVNIRAQNQLTFEEMRKQTLLNLKLASDALKSSNDLESMTIKYEGRNEIIEYPFWIHFNGPIADCLWHTGQLASLRRINGNPINDKLNFFRGTVRE